MSFKKQGKHPTTFETTWRGTLVQHFCRSHGVKSAPARDLTEQGITSAETRPTSVWGLKRSFLAKWGTARNLV